MVRAIPTVYDVDVPDEYVDALSFLQPLDFDLALLAVPGACLGGPQDGLVVFASFPLALCVAWVLFCSFYELLRTAWRELCQRQVERWHTPIVQISSARSTGNAHPAAVRRHVPARKRG